MEISVFLRNFNFFHFWTFYSVLKFLWKFQFFYEILICFSFENFKKFSTCVFFCSILQLWSQEELEDQKMRRRKVFEDSIRKNRTTMSNWFKYAAYEDNMKEIERARSIYERAIDVDHRSIQIWLRYAEMEMRNKQVLLYRVIFFYTKKFFYTNFLFCTKIFHFFLNFAYFLPNFGEIWLKCGKRNSWKSQENSWLDELSIPH